MLSLESLRKIDPSNTADLTDEEFISIRDSFYELSKIAFEDWHEEKFSSKYPVRSLTTEAEDRTI